MGIEGKEYGNREGKEYENGERGTVRVRFGFVIAIRTTIWGMVLGCEEGYRGTAGAGKGQREGAVRDERVHSAERHWWLFSNGGCDVTNRSWRDRQVQAVLPPFAAKIE